MFSADAVSSSSSKPLVRSFFLIAASAFIWVKASAGTQISSFLFMYFIDKNCLISHPPPLVFSEEGAAPRPVLHVSLQ